MKNIYDVLRQKELELDRTKREIEALQITARLLADPAAADVPGIISDHASDPVAPPSSAAFAGIVNPPPALVRHDFREPSADGAAIAATIRPVTPSARQPRRFSRCKVVDLHVIPVIAFQGAGLLLDVSEAGIGVQVLVRQPAPGTTTDLRFNLPDPEVLIEGVGKVAWTDDSGRVGIRFDTIAEKCRPQLAQWLSRQRRSKTVLSPAEVMAQNRTTVMGQNLPLSP